MASACTSAYEYYETLNVEKLIQIGVVEEHEEAVPTCSTTNEDHFMRSTDEYVKLLIALNQVHEPSSMFTPLHGGLAMTIPRSDHVSTKNGWRSVLLENVNRVNLNRFRLKRLIPIEHDLRDFKIERCTAAGQRDQYRYHICGFPLAS